MKLSDLYPTTKIILLGGLEKELKYTFRSIAFIEELLKVQYPKSLPDVRQHIFNSVQSDYMPAETIIVLLRAGLYDESKKAFISAEELIDLIDGKQADEYRKAIIKTYIDYGLNEEQHTALLELEEKKRNWIAATLKQAESLTAPANYTRPCPESLTGAVKLFFQLLKEKLTRLYCKMRTKVLTRL